MLQLSSGIFVEDFAYNNLSNGQIRIKPPEFDYSGTVVTNQGVIICPQQIFTMHGPDWSDVDDDPSLPYGGPPSSNPYYIRFPVLTWNQSAGLFLTVQTTAPSVLTFDRSFTGYVGDVFSVLVNGAERQTIKGSAGYPWTRSVITLGKGTWNLGFVLATAKYTGPLGYVREGYAQSTPTYTDLFRYLRLTNVTITNAASLPSATFQQAALMADSTMTATGTTKVVTGRVAMSAKADLTMFKVSPGPFTFTADSSLAAPNAFIGKLGQQVSAADSTFGVTFTLAAHHASDTGGFAISTLASLSVLSATPQDISSLVRPLRRTSVSMTFPVILNGEPSTPLASCTTEAITLCTAAQYVRRIDFNAPGNTPPATPTWRWLSADAEADPLSGQLTHWHPTTYNGPTWSTPGDYRPQVGQLVLKIAGRLTTIDYPAVQFDAGHLDHLITTMPRSSVNTSGDMTWIVVGAFARFRGQLGDNCPILDFNSSASIDYAATQEYAADRNVYMPWTDADSASSIYLGLTQYSDKDQTSSRFAYRTDDAGQVFGRSDAIAVSDATPLVLIYRLSGKTGTITVTPLVAGHNTSSTARFTRTSTADGAMTSFALGKARITPPFNGSFLTGSMSLLEVDFFNRAITDTEITALQNFLYALYTPVAGGVVEPDYTTGRLTQDSEEVLFYASDPETPLVLLSGNSCVQLGLYPSTVAGRIEIDRFNQQNVPVVQVSNTDYSMLLNVLDGER